MTELELAELMIERRKVAQRAAEIDEQIIGAVLALEETQKMAGVTATYYKESKKTNWEVVVADAQVPSDIIAEHTVTRLSISWAKAYSAYLKEVEDEMLDTSVFDGLTDKHTTIKPARVAIKVKL